MILARRGRASITGITSWGLRRSGEQGRSIPLQVVSPKASGTLTGAGQASSIKHGGQQTQTGGVRRLGHMRDPPANAQRELLGNQGRVSFLTSVYSFPLAPPERLARLPQRLPRWRNKHAANEWLASLERYAFASIGEVPLQRIERSDIIAVLSPIWTTKPETARRVVLAGPRSTSRAPLGRFLRNA